MIGYWHHHVLRLSVCNAVHCDSQGRCTELKVNTLVQLLARLVQFSKSIKRN